MKGKIVYFLTIVICFLLQCTVMDLISIGSVTPVKKLANAAAPMIEATLAFCAGLAVCTNANAPPNKPNIIIGKNPA